MTYQEQGSGNIRMQVSTGCGEPIYQHRTFGGQHYITRMKIIMTYDISIRELI